MSEVKRSAGLVMYRKTTVGIEIFMCKPGGPYFVNNESWGFPKGQVEETDSSYLEAAVREFTEETGIVPVSPLFPIEVVIGKHGKEFYMWAFEGNHEGSITSNTFTMEWPVNSGKIESFPEMEKGAFFSIEEAKKVVFKSQYAIVENFEKLKL